MPLATLPVLVAVVGLPVLSQPFFRRRREKAAEAERLNRQLLTIDVTPSRPAPSVAANRRPRDRARAAVPAAFAAIAAVGAAIAALNPDDIGIIGFLVIGTFTFGVAYAFTRLRARRE
jgi:hypothetical protein